MTKTMKKIFVPIGSKRELAAKRLGYKLLGITDDKFAVYEYPYEYPDNGEFWREIYKISREQWEALDDAQKKHFFAERDRIKLESNRIFLPVIISTIDGKTKINKKKNRTAS